MWKFRPILKTTIWGGERILPYKGIKPQLSRVGESWEVSGVPGSESVVDGGPDDGCTLSCLIDKYGTDLVGKRNLQRFGRQFPLLVKIIDARQDLSVQVHPDDAMAQRQGFPNGKNEMWYVLEGKGARIADGFRSAVNPEQLDKMLADGSIEQALNYLEIRKGDIYYIPAGRVHSLGAGAMVVEVQQTSDLTYRLYDYHRVDADGRERELHIDLARQAIHYDERPGEKISCTLRMNVPTTVVKTPHFTANVLVSESEVMRDYTEFDTFVVIVCVEGEAMLHYGEESMKVKRGMSVLVPASARGLTIAPMKRTIFLEAYINN